MLHKTLIIFISILIAFLCGCVVPVDTDEDGIVDNEDNCIEIQNPGQEDADTDWVGDLCDNCPDVYNPYQEDNNGCNDGDGIGDACEGPCPTDPPAAPANVTASDAVCQTDPNIDEKGSDGHWDQGEIRVTWDAVEGADYYKVYRCDDEECSMGIYNLVSPDDASLIETNWSDTVSYNFTQDSDGAPNHENAWYAFAMEGIDWGMDFSGDVPGEWDQMPLKSPRKYSYKVKAFNSAGESGFSAMDEGNRLPASEEIMYEVFTPEMNIFLNRSYCCNNDPYLGDIMNFEGDTLGSAEFWFGNSTSVVLSYTRFHDYQNFITIFNGSLDLQQDTMGNGWQTGTITFGGQFPGEVDYSIYYSNKWPSYGTYTLRYEGESGEYYHAESQFLMKPTEVDCNIMGIPFGADWDAFDGDCM